MENAKFLTFCGNDGTFGNPEYVGMFQPGRRGRKAVGVHEVEIARTAPCRDKLWDELKEAVGI